MIRHTSIEAYRQIEREGLLKRLHMEVYRSLFHAGPMSVGELWRECLGEYPRPSISPRLAELQSQGVVRTVGERTCRVTGRQVIIWDVTEKLPKKPDDKYSRIKKKIQKHRRAIAALERTLERMAAREVDENQTKLF